MFINSFFPIFPIYNLFVSRRSRHVGITKPMPSLLDYVLGDEQSPRIMSS